MTRERYPTTLSDSTLQYAREHLSETPEKRTEYIQKIREHFTLNESNKIRLTTEDNTLLGFLRVCKYDLPRTIQKIRSYYQLRLDQPKIFTDRDPHSQHIQNILQRGICVPLRLLQNERLVFLIRTKEFNTDLFSIIDVIKVGYLMMETSGRICPQVQVHGLCALIDLEGFGFGHVRQLTPSIVKFVVKSWETHYCSPKLLVFINVPILFWAILGLMKSLMSKKLKERVHAFRGGYEEIKGLIDNRVLPVECGGEDGSIEEQILFWVRCITDQAEWFKFDEQFGILNKM